MRVNNDNNDSASYFSKLFKNILFTIVHFLLQNKCSKVMLNLSVVSTCKFLMSEKLGQLFIGNLLSPTKQMLCFVCLRLINSVPNCFQGILVDLAMFIKREKLVKELVQVQKRKIPNTRFCLHQILPFGNKIYFFNKL